MHELNDIIKINTLGSFVVLHNNENLTARHRLSKKPWMLLKYLVANKDRVISKDRLSDLLCSSDFEGDYEHVINNLVYRLRKMLRESDPRAQENSIILYENGGYRFNKQANVWLDLDEIERIYNRIIQGELSEKETLGLCDQAIELYRFDFLPENLNDEWTHAARTHYHHIYLHVLLEKIRILSINSEYEKIIECCKSAFQIDYFDINIHVEYLKALIQSDNTRLALAHYEEATARLYTQAGITPSPMMVTIYKSIKNGKRANKYSLPEVQEALVAKTQAHGALVCDTDVFGFLYHLEKNLKKRYGESVFLVLVSLIADEEIKMREGSIEKRMDVLIEVMGQALRNSDVITKWSTTQYLLMVYKIEDEHLEPVIKRIQEEYYLNDSDNTLSMIYTAARI
jgi:DNA-binding SARP family transcriptional activator